MRVDKKYLVFEDDSHEFTVDIKNGKNKDTFVLKRSDNPVWTDPGEKVLKAVDDGNGININGVHYEYHQFAELFLLMKSIKKYQKGHWVDLKIKKDVNHK